MSVLKNLKTCSYCSNTIKDDGVFAFVIKGLVKGRWLCCSEKCAKKLLNYAEELKKYEVHYCRTEN